MFNSFSGSHFNPYFHPRSEPVDNQHQTIDSKPPEVCVTYSGEICGGNASAALRPPNTKFLPIKCFDNFGRKNCLKLIEIRVFSSQVAKNIPASLYYLQLFARHNNISLSLFTRSLIKVMLGFACCHN